MCKTLSRKIERKKEAATEIWTSKPQQASRLKSQI
jgi:hypothetical protein